MATTKEQLIKIYQEKLANASNKKTALEEIIRDLNNIYWINAIFEML